MAQSWTDDEYSVTDAAYEAALDKKKRGIAVTRSQIMDRCRMRLPKRDPSSIGPHLGNLTTARGELGLPILVEVAPFKHRPEKLIAFLMVKERLINAFGCAAMAA